MPRLCSRCPEVTVCGLLDAKCKPVCHTCTTLAPDETFVYLKKTIDGPMVTLTRGRISVQYNAMTGDSCRAYVDGTACHIGAGMKFPKTFRLIEKHLVGPDNA